MPEEKTPAPSAPIESPAVTANQTKEVPQPKKAAAKKSTAKKAASKKIAAKKETAPKKETAVKKEDSDKLPVSEVVELLLDGSRRWGTGRDRDTTLANEGYDLEELRREISIARGKRLSNG